MPAAPAHLQIMIVAASRETADALQSYLRGVGVFATTALRLAPPRTISAAVRAIVLFPDDLDIDDLVAAVSALRAARPRMLLVVVTSSPQRLAAALEPDARSRLPVVLPKPAFGWTILDAIREHALAAPP